MRRALRSCLICRIYNQAGTLRTVPFSGITDTAHGTNEGMNVCYVDGHVEWKKGNRIGPIYSVDAEPFSSDPNIKMKLCN